MTRRSAILGFVGVAAAGLADLEVAAMEPEEAIRALSGTHSPVPLPFDPAKLKGLSEKLIRSHWENNYVGSVRALNLIEQRLAKFLQEQDLPAVIYGDLKREELARTGSVVLHEKYFGNLGGDGKPGGQVKEEITKWFGSFDIWETEFRKTAASLSGGSGWAVLSLNLHTASLHNYWAPDHGHFAAFGAPLLVLDMYEHSYHLDFGAGASRYIDAFFKNVDWEAVDGRYRHAKKLL